MNKQLVVVRALALLPEDEVEEFFNDDFREVQEIIDVISDKTEEKYIRFMSKVFDAIEKIEADEKES